MKWLFILLEKIFPFFKKKGKSKNANDDIAFPVQTINEGPTEHGTIEPTTHKGNGHIYNDKTPKDEGYEHIPPDRYPGESQNTRQRNTSVIKIINRPFRESITGKIDELLLKDEKRVGYNPTVKFHQRKPEYFPLVLMPEYNTRIKPPVNGKTANKGMTEESFCRDFLMKYFNGKVYDSLTVFHGNSPMEPDLSFIDLASGKNIFIDIEIDEPYDGVNRTPTHFLDIITGKTSDHERNVGFTNRGWIVIRFAEEQIIKTPDACCKFIGEVIKTIWPGFNSDCFNITDSINKTRIWSREEAINMSEEGKRENYLGVKTFFRNSSPRDYSIKDTEIGIRIEQIFNERKVEKGTGTSPSLKEKPTYNPRTPKPTLPPIVPEVSRTNEPKITKKTETPSQPAPRPYAKSRFN